MGYRNRCPQENHHKAHNNRLVFDQIDSLTAHIGLQLNLNPGDSLFTDWEGIYSSGKNILRKDGLPENTNKRNRCVQCEDTHNLNKN